jgi:hypothetical protein
MGERMVTPGQRCTTTAVAVVVLSLSALSLAGAALASAARAKTISLTGEVIQTNNPYTLSASPHCSTRNILQIQVPAHVVSYSASVHEGTNFFQFSGPPFTTPITGYGKPYYVPKGDAAWFTGGGSGPGPCTSGLGQYGPVTASGVIPNDY